MRVVEYDRFGGPEVLVLRDRPIPSPGPGEVLIRVHAAALNPKDLLIRAGKFAWLSGRRFPKRLAYDWAGEVAALGPSVTGIRLGEALFGMVQSFSAGAAADYLVAKTSELAPRPPGLSWEQAAALPLAASTALQALRDIGRIGTLGRPARVLVNGASGGVGLHAIQLAKALGAHVSAVCSAKNADLVRSLGADAALDYATEDIASPETPYDVFFDVFGNRSLAFARPALTRGGVYISTVPKARLAWDIARSFAFGPHARLVIVKSRAEDLATLGRLVAEGALRPIVDRAFPLEDIQSACALLATKHARGKVVLRM
jgi:NADPH:quinone reductase-like Zn-dependent oxidoreductase